MIGERTLMVVKGPSLCGVNLGFAMDLLRFLALSQTLSPLMKGVKPWLLHEAMTWWASLCVVRASSRVATRDFRWVSTAGIEESEIKEGRAWGS